MEQGTTDFSNEASPTLSPRLIDRTGQRFGRLLVIRFAETRVVNGKRKPHWLCRCDCGNETTVWSWNLSAGKVGSCGCQRGLPAGRSTRNQVCKDYKKNARKRGLSWELADSDFDRLTSQPCFYCGLAPSTTKTHRHRKPWTYNGIDRKNNDLGYTPENTVSCCPTCNYAKSAMPYDEFMAWIARLAAHHFFHPDLTPSRVLAKHI